MKMKDCTEKQLLAEFIVYIKQTNPDIQYVSNDKFPQIPENVSMDISKMNKFLGIENA